MKNLAKLKGRNFTAVAVGGHSDGLQFVVSETTVMQAGRIYAPDYTTFTDYAYVLQYDEDGAPLLKDGDRVFLFDPTAVVAPVDPYI